MVPAFYDFVDLLCRPAYWWGRVRVEGLEAVPDRGPLLIVPTHDSQMDPVIVGMALKPKHRLRFLARASLWKIPGLGLVMDGLGQIPIRRGAGDSAALDRAVASLKAGDALTVFPEGQLTWGERLRARSGVGLLAGWVPEAQVVLCTIEGTTDFIRFPKRPRVTVTFFPPRDGGLKAGEEPPAFAARLLDELRERVPPQPAGRAGVVGGPPRIQRANARRTTRVLD
jgi:1-acyl-sn-glycerol-3-phosphate acyltransferase